MSNDDSSEDFSSGELFLLWNSSFILELYRVHEQISALALKAYCETICITIFRTALEFLIALEN